MALGPKHVEFKRWAEEQGITIKGIALSKLAGKGIGVVATKKLQVLISSILHVDISRISRKVIP